jgi:DNA polymerase-1
LANSGDDDRRAVAEHSSYNGPIQGSCSDFLLASLTEAVRWVLDDGIPAKIILPIHDSLLIEVEESALDEVAHKVRDIMLGQPSMGVPLAVDADVGPSWGALVKYKF